MSAVAFLALAIGLAPQIAPYDFYGYGPYEERVPRPERLLGYGPGERHSTYRDQERVVLALAEAAPNRLRVIEYGKSVQGRPLRIVVATDPENLRRIEDIRANVRRLAEGQISEAEAAQIARTTPPIVWINQCIHGSETASFESAMWLIYTLAASRHREITDLLRQTVIIVNPVYNPDGHERHVVWYESVATGSLEPMAMEKRAPDHVYGRVNHYRFDMNRDRIAMSQDETRQEVAEFLRWNPQVYVDQHGQTSNYFFPPNPMAVNVNIGRNRLDRWTHIFGRAIGEAFDTRGWLYFVKDAFDMYYPGYLDSWTSLTGAIGMTFEADGGYFIRQRRADGSILTLRDGMEKHFVSALATARAAAAHREELMRSFAAYKRRATSGEHAGEFRRVVVTAPDWRPLRRLSDQLALHGVRSRLARYAFTMTRARDYFTGEMADVVIPPNSLVIEMNQPMGPIAKALLEPGSDFEEEFTRSQRSRHEGVPEGERYPGPRSSEFYDITGWSLPYAHGLQAWWSDRQDDVPVAVQPIPPPPMPEPAPVGWAIRYADEDDILAVADLLREGVRVHVATEPMAVQGESFAPGTFLVLRARNDHMDPLPVLRRIAERRGVAVVGLRTSFPDTDRFGPGSASNQPLRPFRVGIIFGDERSTTDFGPIWYLMDRRFGLPFEPLRVSALEGDLSAYSALIFPSSRGVRPNDNVRRWVRAGGCAVFLDGAAVASDELLGLEAKSGRPESLPGSVFRAELDPRSFLSYGYPRTDGKVMLPVLADGSRFFRPKESGGSVWRIPAKPEEGQPPLLLSGWKWDDTLEAVAGTVWAHEEPQGRGHVVAFFMDPTFRVMWPGAYRMLLNAIVIGPNP